MSLPNNNINIDTNNICERLIQVSFTKIVNSKNERGGAKLRKNLLILHVIKHARTEQKSKLNAVTEALMNGDNHAGCASTVSPCDNDMDYHNHNSNNNHHHPSDTTNSLCRSDIFDRDSDNTNTMLCFEDTLPNDADVSKSAESFSAETNHTPTFEICHSGSITDDDHPLMDHSYLLANDSDSNNNSGNTTVKCNDFTVTRHEQLNFVLEHCGELPVYNSPESPAACSTTQIRPGNNLQFQTSVEDDEPSSDESSSCSSDDDDTFSRSSGYYASPTDVSPRKRKMSAASQYACYSATVKRSCSVVCDDKTVCSALPLGQQQQRAQNLNESHFHDSSTNELQGLISVFKSGLAGVVTTAVNQNSSQEHDQRDCEREDSGAENLVIGMSNSSAASRSLQTGAPVLELTCVS